jgi:hypothetical protein
MEAVHSDERGVLPEVRARGTGDKGIAGKEKERRGEQDSKISFSPLLPFSFPAFTSPSLPFASPSPH